ncbi:MAG TPA: phosphoribosyltransferase family protein [Parafilimonas sp.]|nr:phosphoribosyltransferase family protein [Parafilimonas sp.]
MLEIKNYLSDFLHLFFPHNCVGCGTDVLNSEDQLCVQCLLELPETGFLPNPLNPIEKIFYGRLPVEHAGSAFYFNKDSLLQHLIIQFKYRNNREAGIYLGKILGKMIRDAVRFNDIDVIVPLPLNEKKFFKRGYNQAALLAKGITEVWQKPVIEDAVERVQFTETQTHKNRITRWQTMEGVFKVVNEPLLKNKHVLLLDDIITTGATLESCGAVILQAENTKLSICTLAYTI